MARVIPESEVKALKERIRNLERLLGKKTEQVEILREAIELAREKKLISRLDLTCEKRTRVYAHLLKVRS